jgi:hypothetical protein
MGRKQGPFRRIGKARQSRSRGAHHRTRKNRQRTALLEIETAFAEACWKKAISEDPGLANLDGDRQNALVTQFIGNNRARPRCKTCAPGTRLRSRAAPKAAWA